MASTFAGLCSILLSYRDIDRLVQVTGFEPAVPSLARKYVGLYTTHACWPVTPNSGVSEPRPSGPIESDSLPPSLAARVGVEPTSNRFRVCPLYQFAYLAMY